MHQITRKPSAFNTCEGSYLNGLSRGIPMPYSLSKTQRHKQIQIRDTPLYTKLYSSQAHQIGVASSFGLLPMAKWALD